MADGPLPPGSVIGILGGGQLGRMLASAAAELGLACHIYDPAPDSPAFDLARAYTVAGWRDEPTLAAFAAAVDVITYEFENVPAETARFLARLKPVRPGPDVLAIAQDRLAEKNVIGGLGIAVPAFARIDSAGDLEPALIRIGRPAILKTRRLGYDGKGQARIGADDDPEAAYAAIGGGAAILEAFVPFGAEVSALVARSVDGTLQAFDLVENEHRDGILRRSRVPASVAPSVARAALGIGEMLAMALDYVGVLAVEMFVIGTGDEARLLVNEIAPRVHNSGHWTMDACLASQFEQHIRAVAGWPLADPARHSDAAMENLIGDEAAEWAALAARPGAALHLYGKRETRPGRKMGHLTRIVPRR